MASLSTAQRRTLARINRGERLLATETRTAGVLERIGYVVCEDGKWRTTWGGRNYLAGCR